MKNIILLLLLLSILSCQDGPRAVFNDEFIEVKANSELSFKKLVGKYELDDDSKKRFNINQEKILNLSISKDSSFIAENFIDHKSWKLLSNKFKGNLLYTNNYKEKPPFLFLRPANNEFNGGGSFDIYYRKKDSLLAIYVYMPPLKGKEHGDYLRYIKVK